MTIVQHKQTDQNNTTTITAYYLVFNQTLGFVKDLLQNVGTKKHHL